MSSYMSAQPLWCGHRLCSYTTRVQTEPKDAQVQEPLATHTCSMKASGCVCWRRVSCVLLSQTLYTTKMLMWGRLLGPCSIRLPPVLCRCCASLVQPGQQSNIGSAVYSNPELYDRAFSLRDFTEEVRAHLLLHWRYQTHTQAAWTVMCIATMQVDFLETIFSSCVKSGPGSFLELG